MLTVHHLGVSQGERVVWLCEELGLDYKIVKHTRAPLGSPESLKSIPGNELGTSPFIEDDSNGVRLSESGAVLEYLATKYGDGRLMLKPDDAHYADYLQWFHYANGTLQPAQMHYGFMGLAGVAKDNAISQLMLQRLEKRFGAVDTHLGNTKFLAGDSLTLADMMTVYSLTTQRYWVNSLDLTPYKNIIRYLGDISKIPSYQRALEKGDPEMKPLLDAKPPEIGMFEAGGVTSDHWKK